MRLIDCKPDFCATSLGLSMTKDELIPELVRYTEAIHEALETESDSLNRPHYLGHLAMAARIFMYLHRDDSQEQLAQIFRIESRSHAQTLPGEVAAFTRQAWKRFSLGFASFLEQG